MNDYAPPAEWVREVHALAELVAETEVTDDQFGVAA